MKKIKVAFVTSHPIQYQVPVFRALAKSDKVEFRVCFGMIPNAHVQGSGFGLSFQWDVPLLEGYSYGVLENVARVPSVVEYRGCDTPGVGVTLAKWGADVTVVNGWVVKTCIQTLRWCRWHGVPCLVRGEANHLRPRPWWKKMLQKRLVRQFSGVLPIGKANREFYASYGVATSKMFDSPYCVDNEWFSSAAESARPRRHEVRKRWQIDPDATCFLFCGKFESKKHPVELVKAFLRIGDRSQRKVHLLMVGDGALRQECESLVCAWKGSPQARSFRSAVNTGVTFAGFLNQGEIVDAYVASDCLVLPSDHGETWGLVVNEAFASGLPAIVSDQVGCHSDLILPHVTGLTFPFGDWEALRNQLSWCQENRQQLKKMGLAAGNLIRDYSPQAAAKGIVEASEWASHGR